MEKRRIGNTDLYSSVIGFGCWIASGSDFWVTTTETDCINTIDRAYDLGVNFFDVAPVYGYGNAERVLGKALKGKRDKVIVASKCGLVWEEARHERFCLEKQSILKEIDLSLKRLDTDYIDLYQLHWPDFNTPIEESMEAISAIKNAGKIRHVGLSNYPVGLAKEAMKYSEISSEQLLYNLLDRNSDHYHGIPLHYHTKDQMIPFCSANNISVIPYSPLCQGLLSGKYRVKEIQEAGRNDVRNSNPELKGEALERRLAVVEQLKLVAESLQKSLGELALNWLASEPRVSTIICGARNGRQIEENVAAASWKLSNETLCCVNAILDKAGF